MSKLINKMTVRLKEHVWCAILVAAIIIIAVLVIAFGGGDAKVSYASFASALISIILAILVIIYSYIQTGHSEQNIQQMKNLITEGNRINKEMRSSIINVEDQTGSMAQALRTLSEGLPVSDVVKTKVPPKVEAMEFNLSNCKIFVLLVLYCSAKSCEKNRSFSIREIMSRLYKEKGIEEWNLFAAFGIGMLMYLTCSLPPKSVDYSNVEGITIENMPPEFIQYVSDELDRRIHEAPVDANYQKRLIISKETIDTYIEHLSISI